VSRRVIRVHGTVLLLRACARLHRLVGLLVLLRTANLCRLLLALPTIVGERTHGMSWHSHSFGERCLS
jgi:hypothetical protein